MITKVLTFLAMIGSVLAAAEPVKVAILPYGGSNSLKACYREDAIKVGTALAERGITILTPCLAKSGNCPVINEAALEAGGRVVGVIDPRYADMCQGACSERVLISGCHMVQKYMYENSDAYVVMPCGLTTFSAFIIALYGKNLGLHNKPIFLYNSAFWKPVMENLKAFIPGLSGYETIDSVEAFEDILLAEKPSKSLHHNDYQDFCNLLEQGQFTVSKECYTRWLAAVDFFNFLLYRIANLTNQSITLHQGKLSPSTQADGIQLFLGEEDENPWRYLKNIVDHFKQEGFALSAIDEFLFFSMLQDNFF